ncbi:MAG TPA: PTS sugar transporter subunit IIC [Sporosarcina sp.]|nr:PTS sugar transporter subunit IIC [Sporosarcina sp.]
MEKITVKQFVNKVLSGVAMGIVVGLIPNAILGELFKYLSTYHHLFGTLHNVVYGIQFTVPVIVGVLIALEFKLNPLQTVIVGTASFVGSGSAVFMEDHWVLTGVGDLINTMITASIAVLLILLIQDRLKSLTIILLPIIAGGAAGFMGIILLPYVQLITTGTGHIINSFTTLQPLLMYLLVAMAFAILVVSPISTVVIAIAIGVTGLAAGAASIGMVAGTWLLIVGTVRVNNSGVPIAVFLGAMKMMMPNFLRHPIMVIPLVATSAISALIASFFKIEVATEAAGFGLAGFVAPINAFQLLEGSLMSNVIIVALNYFLIPFLAAIGVHYVCTKVLKLYDPSIFKFDTNEN